MLSSNLDSIGLKAVRVDAVDKRTVAEDPMTSHLGVGHVACYKSHCRAMHAFLDTDAPAALILEDDAELHPGLTEVVTQLDWWPQGHGLVKLGTLLNRWDHTIWLGHPVCFTGKGHEVRPLLHRHYGAEGYLINRQTATEALACTTHLSIDLLLFDLICSEPANRWKPLQMLPAPIRQRPFESVGSDTGDGRVAGTRRYMPSLATRVPNKLRLHWKEWTGQALKMRVPYEGSKPVEQSISNGQDG